MTSIRKISKQCEYCGASFTPKVPWSKCCSKSCYNKRDMKTYRERKKQKDAEAVKVMREKMKLNRKHYAA